MIGIKCPNCGNETDFDIKGSGVSRIVKCAKCGHNGSEYQFVETIKK